MARKEHKWHYIYKITCLKNNRYYIGMHSTSNLEDGYFGGGKRIKNSVKKHGKKEHRKEILEFLDNRELLKNREIEIVNEELLDDPLCINLQLGGGGGLPIFKSDEEKKLFHSKGGAESIKINGKIHFDKLKNDEEYHKRFCSALKECKMGDKNSFFNKNHSEETKKIMSLNHIGKHIGNKNSQFGTIWITNGFESKKIKSSELIPNGWKRGRR